MNRDWKACAERMAADAAAGSPLLRSTDPKLRAVLGVDASTVVRWIVAGKRGVFLDGTRSGGRGWHTTTAACARFLEQLTAATSRPSILPMVRRERESGSVSRLGDGIRAMRMTG